jgi:hypothetical protein
LDDKVLPKEALTKVVAGRQISIGDLIDINEAIRNER